jgi:hypothetical protein
VVTDACGARNRAAAERCLDALAFAGDAIPTDIATSPTFFARSTSSDPQPTGTRRSGR